MNAKRITGDVISVLPGGKIVINRGQKDGVEPGQNYQAYRKGEMLTDPKTGEPLAALESICGYGTVEQVRPREATLTLEAVPSERVDVGCYVRRIAWYRKPAHYA